MIKIVPRNRLDKEEKVICVVAMELKHNLIKLYKCLHGSWLIAGCNNMLSSAMSAVLCTHDWVLCFQCYHQVLQTVTAESQVTWNPRPRTSCAYKVNLPDIYSTPTIYRLQILTQKTRWSDSVNLVPTPNACP